MHSALGTGHVVAGRYRLLEQLGRGAMGIVWRGRDTLLDREVAIKQIVLSPLVSETQARASYDRTLREARTAARLSHPGVVTVFDVVEEDGCPWIVMELVRARPLDQVIAEDGPLPPARAAQLGLGLLDALGAAHKAGVLHRDVKPSNVLISPDGKAVLTDFGIATIQGDPGLTQAGMVVGTPGFSPPERVRGGTATPASDLWSLGATLYAAVEGRGPFDRAGGSTAIVASIATEPAPRAPSAGPLAPVIDALLKSDPEDRPDAATTAKMLTQAWKAARTASRVGLPGSAAAGLAGKGAARGRGKPDSEATTATQAMSVPADADLLAHATKRDPVAAVAAAPGVAMASAAVATPAAADAVGVVPDLMATPNFADLKMPGSTTVADEPVVADNLGIAEPADAAATAPDSPPGSPPAKIAGAGTGDDENGRVRQLVSSHRGLVALAPVVVLAIIVGILYATLPKADNPIANVLGGGSGQNQANSNVGSVSRSGSHHHGRTVGRHAGSGGQPPGGSPGPGNPSASGKPSPSGRPSPKPSGKHSSGQPSSSPSTSHNPSTSPSPSPSPSPSTSSPGTGGGPPIGYVWQTVTAASVGTIAGFRIAAPTAWYMNPAVNTVFSPATGPLRMAVNLGTWTYAVAVKQARYLQSLAIAHSRYPRYHLISIGATKFRGWQAARWTFWYEGLSALHPTEVSELFFTAETYEGPQEYIMWVSAPLPKIGAALTIFHVATKTLKVLPYT